MAYHDNPAGRLHDLLRRLAAQNRNGSLLDAWAQVLDVPPEDLALHLGSVANLVRETQEAVDRAGEDALLAPVARYRGVWIRPIFPHDQSYSSALKMVLPDAAALEALALVSAHLHKTARDASVPDADELEELKSQLRDVVEAVRDASDIPDAVKHVILVRLRDVEEAIEHLDIGGPEAVRYAMEAVVGAIFFSNDAKSARSQTVKKVCVALASIWVVFSAGPKIQTSIDAWRAMVPLLEAHGSTPSDGPHKPDTASDGDRVDAEH